MMGNNTAIPADAILNPYTPLAFLSPEIADQYQLTNYVFVAVLAVSSTQCQENIDLTWYEGLYMGLAYGDSGGISSYSQSGF